MGRYRGHVSGESRLSRNATLYTVNAHVKKLAIAQGIAIYSQANSKPLLKPGISLRPMVTARTKNGKKKMNDPNLATLHLLPSTTSN